MSTPGENDIWTPSRLRTLLASQKGLAPTPSCYVIWRVTTRPDAPELGGYELSGVPGRQDEAAFEQWLLERNLAGPERLSVSILVIREQLDEAGLLGDCVLGRGRGGRYRGNPAGGYNACRGVHRRGCRGARLVGGRRRHPGSADAIFVRRP